MTITRSAAARNAATDAVTALIGASGKLKFRIAGTIGAPGAAAATLSLSATAFAASSGGTATANAITSDTAATGNASPVATASLETSGGTLHIHCAVGATVTPTVSGSINTPTVTVGSASGLAVGMSASGTGIVSVARLGGIPVGRSGDRLPALVGTRKARYVVDC